MPREGLGRDAAVAAALFAALTALYSANGAVLPVADTVPNAYLAVNLLDHGSLSFAPSRMPWLFVWKLRGEERERRILSDDDRVGEHRAGDLRRAGLLVPESMYFLVGSVRRDPETGERLYVNLYGPGAALASLPVLAVLRLAVGDLRSRPEVLWLGAKLAASLLVAASVALLYLAARRFVARTPALLLALAYGLGTTAWSAASQAPWQHASSEFFLALGALFFLRAEGRRDAALAGLALSAAVACRPVSAVVPLAVGAWLLFRERRQAVPFALGALPIALALAAHNLHFLGSPFRFGQTYLVGDQAWSTSLLEGAAGLLVSPSRGILVYSPFLVLAGFGAFAALRRPEWARFRPLAAAAVLMLVVHAKWMIWWGGRAYGYRVAADLATLLAFVAIPSASWALARPGRRAVLGALAGWSVAVHALGAFVYDSNGWHDRRLYQVALPGGARESVADEGAARALAARTGGRILGFVEMNVDEPEWRGRLWSLRDSQIGYVATHAAEERRARSEGQRTWFEGWRVPPLAR